MSFTCFATNNNSVLNCFVYCFDLHRYWVAIQRPCDSAWSLYTCMLFSLDYTLSGLKCNNSRSLSDFSFNKFSLCLWSICITATVLLNFSTLKKKSQTINRTEWCKTQTCTNNSTQWPAACMLSLQLHWANIFWNFGLQTPDPIFLVNARVHWIR